MLVARRASTGNGTVVPGKPRTVVTAKDGLLVGVSAALDTASKPGTSISAHSGKHFHQLGFIAVTYDFNGVIAFRVGVVAEEKVVGADKQKRSVFGNAEQRILDAEVFCDVGR